MLTTMTCSQKLQPGSNKNPIFSSLRQRNLTRFNESLHFLSDRPTFILTFALLGDAKVGKTSLAARFCNNGFAFHYRPTNICQLHEARRPLGLGQATNFFHLWELTSDQIQFEPNLHISSPAEMVLRKCSAIFYVYDVTDPLSLKKAEMACLTLALHADYAIQSITLVGNKQDLVQSEEKTEISPSSYRDEKTCVHRLRLALQSFGKKITVNTVTVSSKNTNSQEIDNLFIDAIGPSLISSFRQSSDNKRYLTPLRTEKKAHHPPFQTCPTQHDNRFFIPNKQSERLSELLSTETVVDITYQTSLPTTPRTFTSTTNGTSHNYSFWKHTEIQFVKGFKEFITALQTFFLLAPAYALTLCSSFSKDASTHKTKPDRAHVQQTEIFTNSAMTKRR